MSLIFRFVDQRPAVGSNQWHFSYAARCSIVAYDERAPPQVFVALARGGSAKHERNQ